MLRIILYIISIIYINFNLISQEIYYNNHIGGKKQAGGSIVKTDRNGNIYMIGYYNQNLQYELNNQKLEINTKGTKDIFIFKYNSKYELIWVKIIDGDYSKECSSLEFDNSGNLYISGYFDYNINFYKEKDTVNFQTKGDWDTFIAKYDTNGICKWVKSIGGIGLEYYSSFVLDSKKNIYLTGTFTLPCDFDPGKDTFFLSPFDIIDSLFGNYDIFIEKLDSNGNFIWVKSIGGHGSDVGTSIILDKNNNILITGYFNNIVDFDPGPNKFNLKSNEVSNDGFILKLNNSGEFIWVKQLVSKNTFYEGRDYTKSIMIDSDNNMLIDGEFRGIVDFDPGAGTFNVNSFINVIENNDTIYTGNQNVFLLKLDSNGNFIWVNYIIGTGIMNESSFTEDGNGNIYCTGYFDSTSFYLKDNIINKLVSKGKEDIFVAQINKNGKLTRVDSYGDSQSDRGNYIFSNKNNLLFTGSFSKSLKFDKNDPTKLMNSTGITDAFLISYKAKETSVAEDDISYLIIYPPYPLPANDIVKSLVYFSNFYQIEDALVNVYDLFGNNVNKTGNIKLNQISTYSAEIVWNTNNVSSGVYLISVTMGNKTKAIPVIIEK